ncbi:magnesium transporter [Polluticaenibacter yanchengensis]|uniref:Magnesium transporter MgtE n=1 Tax=Polluticaenibacter yanchengensis TaxID=3014562 RepID=A0ABT4ULJ9_9BACT|nr:magnesium transporter [Chitinophagaceae bacterium LY-5]
MTEELEDITKQQSMHEEFEQLIATDKKMEIRNFLNDQNISDVAQLVYDYPEYEIQIFVSLNINRAASVFKILDFAEQKRIINSLPPFKTAELLNELPSDDRTDFFEEMPSSAVRELIKLLNPEELKTTLSLLGYPENSVGRLMTTDYVYIYADDTVAQAIETIRRYGKDSETVDVIYVIDDKGDLLDDLRIRDIILASPDKKISELMDDRVIVLHAHDDQEVASDAFKMNNRVALPVVSKSNKLLGIVTIDDILWVAEEEFTEDIQMIGGTQALDAPYLDTPIMKLFRKRISWLVVLFLGEMITASVMQHYEGALEKFVVLALFIPLIISSGGNSGSQASTLIIQAIATGDVSLSDWWKIMKREILSGLMLGGVLGIVGFTRVILWNSVQPGVYGEHFVLVAWTIAITLLGIVLWGTLSGSMLPLVLKRLGADPAVSSAPFVATLVDITGLLIYFTVATTILSSVMG